MPTYEYRCPDGHDFEKFVRKISLASSELPCPVCGKIADRRISAGGGLVFKGSGFYITDYGKDGKKAERDAASSAALLASKKTESAASSDTSAKSETSTSESKPAASESTAAKSSDSNVKPAAPSTASESKPAKASTPKANPAKTA
jgi:putative FmdB family regulatory protein